MEKKEEVTGTFFEGKPIGEKKGVQGDDGFSLAKLQRSQFLV